MAQKSWHILYSSHIDFEATSEKCGWHSMKAISHHLLPWMCWDCILLTDGRLDQTDLAANLKSTSTYFAITYIRNHSMYGVFTYIYPLNYPNVGKYTRDGCTKGKTTQLLAMNTTGKCSTKKQIHRIHHLWYTPAFTMNIYSPHVNNMWQYHTPWDPKTIKKWRVDALKIWVCNFNP